MAMRIDLRPGYVYIPRIPTRIEPNPNYKRPNKHTLKLHPHAIRNRIDAEWCPICHSQDIGECSKEDGRIMWVCKTCDYEW